MGLRKADNENAVREGWARDEDNEVVMDGYNAIIQITTSDGTSGFEVQNSIGATSFLADSDGDGYFAKRVGIGTENPEAALEVIGKTRTDQLQVTTDGQLGYVLTSDGDGNATWQANVGSGGVSATGGADGYVAFFTAYNTIAGDNDLYFDRVNNQLQVSNFKLTTTPTDGYILTSDASGNATWQENISSPTNHRAHDQLVHNIAETSYETYTYSGSQVINLTVWTSTEMVTKIREEQYTYSGSKVDTAVIIQYDHLGVAVETLTETYTYSGTKVIDITRTLT